jgi:hypothetical protein
MAEPRRQLRQEPFVGQKGEVGAPFGTPVIDVKECGYRLGRELLLQHVLSKVDTSGNHLVFSQAV